MAQHDEQANAQVDDLHAYLSIYSADEQEELAAAELAIDLMMLLHRVREFRKLGQAKEGDRR